MQVTGNLKLKVADSENTQVVRPPIERAKQSSLGMNITSGEKLTFEKSVSGRRGSDRLKLGVPQQKTEHILPTNRRRNELMDLPELSEVDVVRHFTRLSKLNFSVEENGYPLGSCTMKYNPRVNEAMVRLPGFARLHPETPNSGIQGALELAYGLQEVLLEVTGLADITLLPSAGAHGELTGVMLMRAAARAKGEERDTMLIPDSAHGTNPATCTLAGLKTREIPTGKNGVLEPETVAKFVNDKTLGIMITNPNTAGLFESNIDKIAEVIHNAGGYVYMDGANLNALLEKARPGHFGVDAMHINLHKTFSQPHGGGGPGAGPVAVSEALAPYLPVPKVVKQAAGNYILDESDEAQSIGYIREFLGNFGVYVRAYAYILRLGGEGLKSVTEMAVLNANYIRARLQGAYALAFDQPHMHEALFSDAVQQKNGVSTMDIGKRLLDYGFHSPTTYFPLTVKGAMLIEPTESETLESLDSFCDCMVEIAKEAEETPEIFANAPYTTPASRLDQTRAARNPVLRWKKDK